MMKHLIMRSSLLFVLMFVCSGIVISAVSIAENFPVYSIKGERKIFYKIIDSLRDDGLLIVNFTSVNCKPCKKEIPELKSITESANGKLKLMCIYAEAADLASGSAESLGVADNSYGDPFGNIQKMYSVKKYPVTFVIDKNYKVLGRYDGYTPENIKKIRKLCGVQETR